MILPKSPFINKTKGLPLVLPSAVNIAKRSIEIEFTTSTIKFAFSSIRCDMFFNLKVLFLCSNGFVIHRDGE